MTILKDDSLHRFWFSASDHFGVGVTARSEQEAKLLAQSAAERYGWHLSGEVIVDVDIRDLDQGHVIPNMGPPNFQGVWYPCENMSSN
jgi:hypothetical protein